MLPLLLITLFCTHSSTALFSWTKLLAANLGVGSSIAHDDPIPTPWPLQFHALLFQNRSGKLSIVDL